MLVVLKKSTIVLRMRTDGHAGIGDLLFGQTRGKLLSIFYGSPDRTAFLRQIARETGISIGTLQRELNLLAEVGLLRRSASGKQVYYQANREHPLFAELSSVLAKTFGVFELLRAALQPLATTIEVAFVYGSVARGVETAESDVDLAIIGDAALDDVIKAVGPVERSIGRPVNPTIYSRREFSSKLRSGNHFLNSLLQREKVFLIGDEHELGKMGRVRLVARRANQSSRNS